MDRKEIQRWLARFSAIEEVDREAIRTKGPRPAWAISLALSMMEAAQERRYSTVLERVRQAEEEAVRRVWQRLRERQ